MALIIKSNETKKIMIAGTSIELADVYMRIEFAARANGVTLEVAGTTYVSKATYETSQPIFTDIQAGNVVANIGEGQEQSLITAHEYAKQAYEELGYTVDIDLS